MSSVVHSPGRRRTRMSTGDELRDVTRGGPATPSTIAASTTTAGTLTSAPATISSSPRGATERSARCSPPWPLGRASPPILAARHGQQRGADAAHSRSSEPLHWVADWSRAVTSAVRRPDDRRSTRTSRLGHRGRRRRPVRSGSSRRAEREAEATRTSATRRSGCRFERVVRGAPAEDWGCACRWTSSTSLGPYLGRAGDEHPRDRAPEWRSLPTCRPRRRRWWTSWSIRPGDRPGAPPIRSSARQWRRRGRAASAWSCRRARRVELECPGRVPGRRRRPPVGVSTPRHRRRHRRGRARRGCRCCSSGSTCPLARPAGSPPGMRVLVTNDDGVESEGIRLLASGRPRTRARGRRGRRARMGHERRQCLADRSAARRPAAASSPRSLRRAARCARVRRGGGTGVHRPGGRRRGVRASRPTSCSPASTTGPTRGTPSSTRAPSGRR